MADFALTTLDFLACAGEEDLAYQVMYDPIVLAIYAPGLACADYARHQDGGATLSYAYLAPFRDGWAWLGRECVQHANGAAHPQPWATALDQRHPLAGTALPVNWRATTRRAYWSLVPLLGLLLQLEPQHGMLRGALRRITTGKQTLSARQHTTLQAILRERGAVEFPENRSRELAAHRHVLLWRRDLAFRLARLAALDLSITDRETVQSLTAANVAWRNRRMRTLSDAQAVLVGALEARYLTQRLADAKILAEEWITRLGITQ
ncbi:MAG: hypothetical protein JXA21_17715 [Anaerolineae bacterium]|nr:hypothetical protein [Anaerolineae bacterium]